MKIALINFIYILSINSFAGNDILSKKVKEAEKNIKSSNYKDAIKDYTFLSRRVKSKGIYFYYIARYSLAIDNKKKFTRYIRKAINYSPQYYSILKRDTIFKKCNNNDIDNINHVYELSKCTHNWMNESNTLVIDTLEELRKKDQRYRTIIMQTHQQYHDYAVFKPKFDSLMFLQKN